jgi:hypothetical protein
MEWLFLEGINQYLDLGAVIRLGRRRRKGVI